MRFCTLFSGSSGNSLYIESGGTRILIDAGKNTKAVNAGLSHLGLSLSDIDAIFLTHAHSDHISALPVLARHYSMPIIGTRGTLETIVEKCGILPSRLTLAEEKTGIGSLQLLTFATPHDAKDSVGYIVRDETGKKLSVALDLGYMPGEVFAALKGSDFVIIESNYDEDMLEYGPYTYELKMRVRGQNGHLSNGDCAYNVCRLAEEGCMHFMLAHLSENNNTPQLAFSAACSALAAIGAKPGEVTLDIAPRHTAGALLEF